MQTQAKAASMLVVLAAVCGCSGLAMADAASPADTAMDFINAHSVSLSASVECRFVFEYAPTDVSPEAAAGKADRAATFSGSLSDGKLQFSSDRRTLSGLGLAFDYDLMTDSGRGRMARESGSANPETDIALGDIVPASFKISDVTPQNKSIPLDWLRTVLPSQSFSSLDRVAGTYQSQGLALQQSAGGCALGDVTALEIRWKAADGASMKSAVLWPLETAKFEQALRSIVGSANKPQR
jgi:hypothetical protein